MAGSCPASPPPALPESFWAGLLSISSSPAWMDTRDCSDPGAAPALGLLKPHEIPKLAQVPLGGILSFRSVSCSTQLGVICKCAEGALNPSAQLLMKGSHSSGSLESPFCPWQQLPTTTLNPLNSNCPNQTPGTLTLSTPKFRDRCNSYITRERNCVREGFIFSLFS